MCMSPEPAASGFSFPSLVEEIRHSGLTAAEIGRITGVRERQVQNWAAGSSRPASDARDRLVDIHYIVRLLKDVYRPEGIEIWLHARNQSSAAGGRSTSWRRESSSRSWKA